MQRNRPNSDYLKYWKTVKQWAKAKYNLTNAQVELMLFLYDILMSLGLGKIQSLLMPPPCQFL